MLRMSGRITLVRHGRSAHVHSGWLSHAAFLRWREEYEAAGIDPTDTPPSDLTTLAAGSGVVVASTAPRAVASAKSLSSAPILTTPLLRELDLRPPRIAWIRLPLPGWALTLGVQSLLRGGSLHRPVIAKREQVRAQEAAAWLIALAKEHGSVLAVTHASFRSVLAEALRSSGWQSDSSRRSSHWSAWSFVSRD